MINRNKCFLCNTECESHSGGNFDVHWFRCSRCGNFGVTHTLEVNAHSDSENKAKAAMLAAERKIQRPGSSFVLSDEFSGVRDKVAWLRFDEFISQSPKSAYEMLERTLLNLALLVSHPSETIKVTEPDCFMYFSRDARGQLYMLRQMRDMGWITSMSTVPGQLTIEAKGWQKVDDLSRKTDKDARQAFVAMWFHESMQEVFEIGIRPAIEKSGKVKCLRIDQLEHNNKICDQIIAEIRRSKYLIADFSGNRGGVYFEAGFAQGLGLPVIWLVGEDHLGDVHFDTRQYNYIVYSTPKDLYEKLCSRIEATINEDGPKA